jgi:hypothetical protein
LDADTESREAHISEEDQAESLQEEPVQLHQAREPDPRQELQCGLTPKEQEVLDTFNLINQSMGSEGPNSEIWNQILKRVNNLQGAVRDPEKFVLSEEQIGNRPVSKRDEELSSVFGSQRELDYYRFVTEVHLSAYNSDRLLKMITKVLHPQILC